MGATRARLRAEVRGRWRSWVALALVTGFAAGGAIAAFAGARRTETAYERFLEGTRRADVLVSNGSPGTFNQQFDFDEVARLPGVSETAPVNYYFTSGETPAGRPLTVSEVISLAPGDGRFGASLNRAEVLEGRAAVAADEVVVTFLTAERYDIAVGDELSLAVADPTASAPAAEPAPTPFRVVGVVAVHLGFPPLSPSSIPPLIIHSEAFARARPDAAEVLAVRLDGGREDVDPFVAELERLAGGTQLIVQLEGDQTPAVQRGLDVQAAVLRLLGTALAGTALLLSALGLSRLAVADGADREALRAVGATRSLTVTVAAARAAIIAVGVVIAAWTTATALSPLAPVGVARHAELRPGVDVNLAVLALGAAAIVVVLPVLGTVLGWWSIRSGSAKTDDRPSTWARTLSRVGAPVSALSGVRMALERGRGMTAVPVRSTLGALALGVAIVAGMSSFTASISYLFDRPSLYGWNWDLQVGGYFSPDLGAVATDIQDRPEVDDLALAGLARLQVGGQPLDALGVAQGQGAIQPTVVDGRAPSSPDEILLGVRTRRDLDLAVGDDVEVSFGGRTRDLRVVGTGVLSEFAGAARLGAGASLTFDGLRELAPDAVRSLVLVRTAEGVDPEALAADLRADYAEDGVSLPETPSDLADLEGASGLPLAVASVLGLLALVVLATTLVSSVRRRRHDLAVLKVLGLVPGQVGATVAWQSTTLALLAGLVGLPVGIAAGRTAWDVFADGLGVPPRPTTPLLTAVLLIVTLLVLANLVAAVPGRLAARASPADALRSE